MWTRGVAGLTRGVFRRTTLKLLAWLKQHGIETEGLIRGLPEDLLEAIAKGLSAKEFTGARRGRSVAAATPTSSRRTASGKGRRAAAPRPRRAPSTKTPKTAKRRRIVDEEPLEFRRRFLRHAATVTEQGVAQAVLTATHAAGLGARLGRADHVALAGGVTTHDGVERFAYEVSAILDHRYHEVSLISGQFLLGSSVGRVVSGVR